MAEFASAGKGNAALTLGIIGTGLAALGGGLGNGMGGILPGARGGAPSQDDAPVTRYEWNARKEYEKQLGDKDTIIAELYADKVATTKAKETLAEFRQNCFDPLVARMGAVEGAVGQQAVYNATLNATVGCIQNQVNTLMGMTKTVIPNSSVCPGWGTATVSVSTGTTTA